MIFLSSGNSEATAIFRSGRGSRWPWAARLLLLLLLSWFGAAPQPARAFSCPAVSGAAFPGAALHGQAILRDPSGSLSLEDVSSPARAAEFVPLSNRLTAGYTRDVLWLRFCLPAGQPGARPNWLRIAPPMLDDLTLYLPRGGGYQSSRTGDHHPFVERDWAYRLFAMAVPSDIDASRPAYLRIDTSSALNLRLDLWPEADFQQLVVRESMFYGVLSGAVLLLAAFSVLAWLWLRDRLYLFYALNVLAGGVFLLMNAGFGAQVLYPQLAGINDRLIAWLTGPILAVHILFFTYLFAVRRHLPRLYPLMLVIAAMYVALVPLSFVTDWRNIGLLLQFQAFPVTSLWIFLVVYLGWKDRERRVYVLAFVPWLMGLFANALVRLGSISEYFLVNYSGELTALIHLVVLPALIVHRARRAEQEKEKALARELKQAQRVERELEARVRQRTAELRQEIRARGALQEKLQETLAAEQATLANQRQLVAMLSHEFRTPLATIDAAIQNLDLTLEKTQPQLKPRIGKIRRATGLLLNLLENCLADERLNGTGAELHLADLDLREYLHSHYAEQPLVRAQRIRLQLPETPVPVCCDHHLLGVAVANLVDNALKYSPEDAMVDVRLLPATAHGMVAIEVQDRGPGVRPEDRERIFERFFRGASRQGVAGAGFGLHLARLLMRRHGGDIVLRPGAPGQGALFVLTLPARQPDASPFVRMQAA